MIPSLPSICSHHHNSSLLSRNSTLTAQVTWVHKFCSHLSTKTKKCNLKWSISPAVEKCKTSICLTICWDLTNWKITLTFVRASRLTRMNLGWSRCNATPFCYRQTATNRTSIFTHRRDQFCSAKNSTQIEYPSTSHNPGTFNSI